MALQSGADLVSISVREMPRDDVEVTARFYVDCAAQGIFVQHILYDRADAEALAGVLTDAQLRDPNLQLLFVPGRYTAGQSSDPSMIAPFTDWLAAERIAPDWMICAFGPGETAALVAGQETGGKIRIGFENSFWHSDGRLARDNAERVADILGHSTFHKA